MGTRIYAFPTHQHLLCSFLDLFDLDLGEAFDLQKFSIGSCKKSLGEAKSAKLYRGGNKNGQWAYRNGMDVIVLELCDIRGINT